MSEFNNILANSSKSFEYDKSTTQLLFYVYYYLKSYYCLVEYIIRH